MVGTRLLCATVNFSQSQLVVSTHAGMSSCTSPSLSEAVKWLHANKATLFIHLDCTVLDLLQYCPHSCSAVQCLALSCSCDGQSCITKPIFPTLAMCSRLQCNVFTPAMQCVHTCNVFTPAMCSHLQCVHICNVFTPAMQCCRCTARLW